jgi:hypothetical protein
MTSIMADSHNASFQVEKEKSPNQTMSFAANQEGKKHDIHES